MTINKKLLIGKDINNVPLLLEINIENNNELSIIGNSEGSGGQIVNSLEEFINDKNNTLFINKETCKEIISIWRKKHLSILNDEEFKQIYNIIENNYKNNDMYNNIEFVDRPLTSGDVLSFNIKDKTISLYINDIKIDKTSSSFDNYNNKNVFKYIIDYQIEDNITGNILTNDKYEFQTSIIDFMNNKKYMQIKELIFSFKTLLDDVNLVLDRSSLNEFIKDIGFKVETNEDYIKIEDQYLELDRLASKLGYLIEDGFLNILTEHEMTEYIGLEGLKIENIEENNIMRF